MSGHRLSLRCKMLVASALVLLAGAARADEPVSGTQSDVVVQALSLLGTPYRFGGGSPQTGFDCSGLVRHVFGPVLGWELPRRSEEMRGVGRAVTRGELQPGDLVFFNTLRRAFSHVAIYIGEGRFVHAPAKSGRVRVEGLDDHYWTTRFDGARRVLAPIGPGSDSATFVPAEAARSRASEAEHERAPGP